MDGDLKPGTIIAGPACSICKGPLDFGAPLIELGKRACCSCHEKAMAIRRDRWNSSRIACDDIYSRLRSELNAMYAERRAESETIAGLKRERESLVASFKAEAESAVVDRVRRMSFWKRLRLLFHPFATEISE